MSTGERLISHHSEIRDPTQQVPDGPGKVCGGALQGDSMVGLMPPASKLGGSHYTDGGQPRWAAREGGGSRPAGPCSEDDATPPCVVVLVSRFLTPRIKGGTRENSEIRVQLCFYTTYFLSYMTFCNTKKLRFSPRTAI